ncbi:DUF4139 domain-containing protein [Ramlibacter sp. AN1133]|uniref:DUF4139 domain-containing protein n=1 Tax=Ramlibacter sp. AN1133 TaxID=3133429 RepID=UPI0030BC4A2B
MPHAARLLTLLFAAAPWIAQAQAVAPVTAVTLYPGSATVVRSARIEPGSSRLVVGELTTQFQVATLRVEADPGIRIGQVVTQDAARTESANAAQAALEAKIQALRDQAAALDAQSGAADIVRGYLERAGGDPTGERGHAPVDAKSLTAMVAAISQAATEALGRKQQVAVQKRALEQQVQALERDMQRVRSESRDSRTLTVNYVADRAGAVRISYQVNSAGWRPAYRAELDSTASTVQLDRLAQVAQKTGEDWRNVRLSLSTAQPRLSPVAVTPQPWLLSYLPPQPPQERRAAPTFAPAPAPAAPAGALLRDARDEAYEPPTFQADSAFATEFIVPTPVTLPADGREVTLPLAGQKLAAKQLVQVTPRLSTTAFVVAEVPKPAGVWPPGNLQLLRDGNYVGASGWAPEGTEKWSFSFGRDDLLQVRINAVQGDSGTAGVFDKRNVRRIADEITVRSNHRTPVDVLVIEATPVSTSDEVKVQASFNPRPTVEGWEQRRGVVAWQRTVQPQETARIEVGYVIEYPREGVVTGLR